MGRERDLVRVKNKGERKKIKNKGKNKKNKKKEKKCDCVDFLNIN